jgi:serine protease Do
MESILRTGRVVRGYLGVVLQELTPDLAAQLGAPGARGALIVEVAPGTPAAAAGLRPGDIVRRFAGRDIRSGEDFRRRISEAEVGREVELEGLREGRPFTLAIAPAEIGAPQPQRAP